MHRNRAVKRWGAVLLIYGVCLGGWAEDVAVRVGNPLLDRFPVSGDARPRSIWDLHTFDGKIYLAHGDYWNNRGPVDIWTYAGDGTNFVKEYTTNEEMVWDYFEQDGKLWIPGVDAREGLPDISNLYLNDPTRLPNPGWIKQRTLTGGVHSYDVALFKGRLYASLSLSDNTGLTVVSTNMGQTWATVLHQYSALVAFDSFIYFQGPQQWICDGQTWKPVSPILHVNQLAMARKTRFRDGLVYSYPVRYGLTLTTNYFISASTISNSGTAMAIEAFTDANVRDTVVRGNVCYVLTAEEIQRDGLYRGRIHASDDLETWHLATEFTVPGIPLSFEILSNRFYVGIGSRFDGSNWDVLIGPEAGSLWCIHPEPVWTGLRPDGATGMTLELGVVPGFWFEIQSTPKLDRPEWTPVVSTNSVDPIFTFTDPDVEDNGVRFYRLLK